MTGHVTVFDPRTGERIMDESGPTTPPPVMPSLGDTAGIKAQQNINEATARMGSFAVMSCCFDAALELIQSLEKMVKDLGGTIPTTGGTLTLSTFTTDHRMPIDLNRVGNQYVVSRKKLGS